MRDASRWGGTALMLGAMAWAAAPLQAVGPSSPATRGVSSADRVEMRPLQAGARGRVLAAMVLEAPAVAAQGGSAAQATQPPPRPPAVDGFVPIDEIPDHDKLPAAPYLIAAYAIAWVAILFYIWSLWGRLSRVEEELKRLTSGASKP